MAPPRRQPAKKDPAAQMRPYTRIIRDLALVGLAIFIFIHETTKPPPPDPALIAAGLVMLGLPSAIRLMVPHDEDHQ
jgi:hypothetical protein